METGQLTAGLDRLGQGALHGQLAEAQARGIPIYLLQGGRDVIAPPEAMTTLAGAARQFFPHGGHPLFLEADFNPQRHRRKGAIRDKFSRAAATYDDYAATQQESARRLAERLPPTGPGKILELGCGTGNLTRLLAARYPGARITALDFSAPMLRQARAKVPEARATFLCRDAELYLESCPESYDLIVANATLQWFDDLDRTLGRIAACLAPGGLFAASIFGPASLAELRRGLRLVNPDREIRLPVDDFPTPAKLENLIRRHLTAVASEEWHHRRTYHDLPHLFRHLRRTGTTGPDRRRPLLDRPRFATLDRWFAGELGEYRLTYQIFLVQGRRTT